ncbi:MAG: nucleotidyltransferase domain-containing protein [Candidatus Hydrothermarchaeales archaeon]
MIQLYQKIKQLKVLELFIENPYSQYYLREIARILDISPMTVKRTLDLLEGERLIKREKQKHMVLFRANMESQAFKNLKIAYNLALFEKKGLVNFIKDRLKGLSSLMLYGSYAKGENDRDSDIDLLAISTSKESTSFNFSGLLGREAHVTCFTPAKWESQAESNKAFYLDVITEGIVLYGTRPVVK